MDMIGNKFSVLILLAAFLFAFGCAQSTTAVDLPGAGSGNGSVVFLIKDAAADMGAITSVNVTIDSVQAHSAADGWVTASYTAKTYDLLQLKASGNTVLLADAQLKNGTYDQVRLHISSVTVTDANGTHEAKLPSGELKIVGGLVVNSNTTSSVTFDFVADESIHITGNGKYIMAPVVHFEARENASVRTSNDQKVEVEGGSVSYSKKVGMDAQGNVGEGRGIAANVGLSIGSNGGIVIGAANAVNGGNGNANANANAVVSIAMVSIPAAVQAKQPVNVRWNVASSKQAQTPHTSVHFGYTSVPSNPTVAAYAYSTEYLTGTVPSDFSANMTPEFGGIVYYRAHVVVDGVSYWTNEATVLVSVPVEVQGISGASGALNMITGAAKPNADGSASTSGSGSVNSY